MSVSYTRINFKTRVVQYPRSYTESNNAGGGITHTPKPGTVVQEGILPNEANMNAMDKGIADCAAAINQLEQVIAGLTSSLGSLRQEVNAQASSIRNIQTTDEQQSAGITAVTNAHNALAEDEEALENSHNTHVNAKDNPHETDIFAVMAQVFTNAWGAPAKVGTYTGNGGSQATLTVNGYSVRGQQINLGFAPSKVVILVPNGNLTIGHSEITLFSNTVLDVACAEKYGAAIFGPSMNYYHSDCGYLRTNTPETVLRRLHGGAVVYGDGFIVQAYSNNDNDTTMRVNSKNVTYRYLAWA